MKDEGCYLLATGLGLDAAKPQVVSILAIVLFLFLKVAVFILDKLSKKGVNFNEKK